MPSPSRVRRPSLLSVVACVAGLSAVAAGLSEPDVLRGADAPQKKAEAAPKAPAKPKRTPQEQKALTEFMRVKLSASETILEGLVTEDYEMVEKGAKKLQELSAAEKWRISNDAIYRQHSQQFSRVAGDLAKAAKDENLQAAALHWVEATMSCIECHRFVKAMLITDGAPLPGLTPRPTLGR